MRKQCVVKLGAKQLRQIITEAIQAKQFGEPEPYAICEVKMKCSECGKTYSDFSGGEDSDLGNLCDDCIALSGCDREDEPCDRGAFRSSRW